MHKTTIDQNDPVLDMFSNTDDFAFSASPPQWEPNPEQNPPDPLPFGARASQALTNSDSDQRTLTELLGRSPPPFSSMESATRFETNPIDELFLQLDGQMSALVTAPPWHELPPFPNTDVPRPSDTPVTLEVEPVSM